MSSRKFSFSEGIDWIRKSISEISEPGSVTDENGHVKRDRSQSMMVTAASKLTSWGAQRSFESGPLPPLPSSPVDFNFEDPVELQGSSVILTPEDVSFLGKSLPARLVGSTWHLLFSTESHGFSLSSIYRLAKEKDSELKSPCLLLIRDTDNHCFGAYLSESPKLSDKCYGCGETFVFTLNPTQKTYKWSAKCEKNFFIWGSTDSISVGVDDGKFALYLDSALNQGRSQAVSTFENEPLTTENGDFIALQVEVWTFR